MGEMPITTLTAIALNTYLKKRQSSNISFYFKKLRPEEQIKSKVRKRKEIINSKVEINEIENRKSMKPCWFFELNRISKPLATMIRRKERRYT